ncbi:MAG: hypothetical protein HY808_06715 [Nitrospirae bacterium]|nr:hypothetical protein [Nitrospirota bacterium]
MKTYVCQICSHIAFDQAPVDCPVCRMPIENFENNPDAVKKPADPENLCAEDRKHLPVIQVNRECSLNQSAGYMDVHVKIGEIEHEMTSEHLVNFIDIYLDKKFIMRTMLTHRRIHPATALRLNVNSGTLTVIGNCTLHGSWMKRVNLSSPFTA